MVTTAITNLDLHDIARSARTYAVDAYHVVHPVAAQRELADRVRRHWVGGSGARRIPDRAPALELLDVHGSLAEATQAFGAGAPVEHWSTSAAPSPRCLAWGAARERLAAPGPPVLLLFGTGWGLADEVLEGAAVRLEPISASVGDGYNHLSVRAAVAITLDRLRGER